MNISLDRDWLNLDGHLFGSRLILHIWFRWLKKTHTSSWKIKNTWIRALYYVKYLNAQVYHIYREGNCMTDKLTSWSIVAESKKVVVLSSKHHSRLNIERYIGDILVPLLFYRFKNQFSLITCSFPFKNFFPFSFSSQCALLRFG